MTRDSYASRLSSLHRSLARAAADAEQLGRDQDASDLAALGFVVGDLIRRVQPGTRQIKGQLRIPAERLAERRYACDDARA